MATTHSPSRSASLSLFDFYTQTPFTSRTVVAWRVRISPCVGYSCDRVASIGFTQEILSLKLTKGIFELHSLSFFFTRHKTTFKGVDAVRQTNYCPPTAGGRVPYDSSCKHAVMKEDWCTRVCHRLLVSWLAPLRQTLSFFFFLHSSLFTKGGERLRVEILPLVAVGFLLLFVLSKMKGRTL